MAGWVLGSETHQESANQGLGTEKIEWELMIPSPHAMLHCLSPSENDTVTPGEAERRRVLATPQSRYWKTLEGRPLQFRVQPAFSVLWKTLKTLRELSRNGVLRFQPREKL